MFGIALLKAKHCKNDVHLLELEHVSNWLRTTGYAEGRVLYWEGREEPSVLYTDILKPLLSIRTVCSVTVERVAKPLKNKIATQDRSSASVAMQNTLLRIGVNLNCLERAGHYNVLLRTDFSQLAKNIYSRGSQEDVPHE